MIWVVLGRIRASYKARVDGASVPESSEEELLEIGPLNCSLNIWF